MDGEPTTGLRTLKAAVVVVPFLLLGLGNGILILQWGFNPVWGLLLFPPVLFISAIGWIALSGGIVDRGPEG